MAAAPESPSPIDLRKGSEVVVTIEKFADRGASLTRVGGCVLFVQGAIPGDVVRVRVLKKKRKYAEGRVVELLTSSPLRIEPRCPYFGSCGGCRWQHLGYENQLEAKRDSVAGALSHVAGLDFPVAATIASERQFYYRNKMEFSFSSRRWLTRQEIDSGQDFDQSFALGLHVPKSFARVIDLQECHLQSQLSSNIVNRLRELSLEHGWRPWDVKAHTGYLRHLVIRQSARFPDVMVNLVTNGHDGQRIELLAETLRADFPEVTTFVNTIHTGVAQTARGQETIVIFGPGSIRERIGRFQFEVGPESFFQTNTVQAERLYEETCKLAQLGPEDVAYDLYCGTGTIALLVADHVARVVGMESVGEAVYAARTAAAHNGVENVTFVRGLVERDMTPEFAVRHGRPDVVIVDPPRAGLHPKVLGRMSELRPDRIVYVSCNPQTQARDISMLADAYDVTAVQPVDLFPQTDHVECVASLRIR
jgi:23S rRNA (uracil1939-C5)-methyltransferase